MKSRVSRLGALVSLLIVVRMARLLGNLLGRHGDPEAGQGRRRRREELPVLPHRVAAEEGDPHDLNDAGKWLVAEKDKRGAKTVDGAWIKDYPGNKK